MAHNFLSTTFTAAVLHEQETNCGRAQKVPPAPGPDELGAQEEVFIQRRDSFHLTSVNADGWPCIQHRGGPQGFLKLLDPHTLALADLSGNRRLLTTGNVATNDRVALFLMDYPRRERLKILGHVEVIPARPAPRSRPGSHPPASRRGADTPPTLSRQFRRVCPTTTKIASIP